VSAREPDLLERLVPGVTSPDDPPTVGSFVRGLAIGALVGAAIAGSTLWQRRRSRGSREQSDPGSLEPVGDNGEGPATGVARPE
jgi:hypothetical protein